MNKYLKKNHKKTLFLAFLSFAFLSSFVFSGTRVLASFENLQVLEDAKYSANTESLESFENAEAFENVEDFESGELNESRMFKAEIVEVIAELEKTRENGSTFKQQDLRLKILNGERKGQEVFYYGISEMEVVDSNIYQKGERVFVDSYISIDGEEVFYVVDFLRSRSLIWLFLLFIFVVLLVGRFKGLKALLSLFLSFVVIVKFILPLILKGQDPFLISLIGASLILAIIIYLTEGWQRKSHLGVLAVFISLSFTLFLSLLFVKISRLSGLAQEETMFLVDVAGLDINFQGLLLAGFVIGAIGVLDDIIVGQIEAVEQIRIANPKLSAKRVFNLSYKVGNTHLGAIINTLFLTYTGAALPLLLLFALNSGGDLNFERFINMEAVSTEVVRTLVGSIGVILSMPIATFLASFWPRK